MLYHDIHSNSLMQGSKEKENSAAPLYLIGRLAKHIQRESNLHAILDTGERLPVTTTLPGLRI